MIWRLQPPRVEIIADLENIMKTQLMYFYRRTNHKPERIFFYRDGVSEGQFAQVIFVWIKHEEIAFKYGRFHFCKFYRRMIKSTVLFLKLKTLSNQNL